MRVLRWVVGNNFRSETEKKKSQGMLKCEASVKQLSSTDQDGEIECWGCLTAAQIKPRGITGQKDAVRLVDRKTDGEILMELEWVILRLVLVIDDDDDDDDEERRCTFINY
jgi:hypothetical protein